MKITTKYLCMVLLITALLGCGLSKEVKQATPTINEDLPIDQQIMGKWDKTNELATIEFFENGTFIENRFIGTSHEGEIKGKYQVENNGMTLKIIKESDTVGIDYNLALKGDTMIWQEGMVSSTYVKEGWLDAPIVAQLVGKWQDSQGRVTEFFDNGQYIEFDNGNQKLNYFILNNGQTIRLMGLGASIESPIIIEGDELIFQFMTFKKFKEEVSSKTNIIFYTEQNWEGEFILTFSAERVKLMESSDGFDYDEFVQQFEESMKANQPSNIEVETSFLNERLNSGEIVLTVLIKGKEYESLKVSLLNKNTEIIYNNSEIKIRSSSQRTQGFSKEVFTITGDEIISSNADRVEGQTAIWENPTLIETTLKELP